MSPFDHNNDITSDEVINFIVILFLRKRKLAMTILIENHIMIFVSGNKAKSTQVLALSTPKVNTTLQNNFYSLEAL